MALRRRVSGLLAATLLIFTVSDVHAQSRRPSRTVSLGEIKCIGVNQAGGKYRAINEDIPVGRQIFRAVGEMRTWSSDRTEMACRLAGPGETPRFRRLTLALGLDDRESSPSTSVRLSIYKDGNFYSSQTVTKGDKILWPIDVKNTRTLSVEAETTANFVPLYFFQDTLE